MALSVYPCIWTKNKAKEAAEYYCRIFPGSRIVSETAVVVKFELSGKTFMTLNGGITFPFNESVSFVIPCETQEEIDHFWNALTADGGKESECGWCSDKFGVSWQVVPTILDKLMSDPERAERVTAAFLKMKKFNIENLLLA